MNGPINISYKLAETPQDFSEGASLFQQYADSLGIDLEYQNFPDELKSMEKLYNKPKGALLLALIESKAIGCVALRQWDNEIAELKRMFVQEEFQGHKIGQKLLDQILEVARELHYKKVRLDTLPSMKRAQKLYTSNGFYEIPSYRFSPVEGTVYLEKVLD